MFNDLLIEVDVELLLGGGILKGWRIFLGVRSPLSLDSSLEVFNSDLAVVVVRSMTEAGIAKALTSDTALLLAPKVRSRHPQSNQ